MIIVHLTGGLGNQLFQYALGRQLALKHKTNLRLDVFGFRTYKRHRYSLAPFNITASLAGRLDIAKIKIFNTTVNEQNLSFNPNVLNADNNVYLKGYWQSEKYFKDIEEAIRKEITLKEPQDKNYMELLARIKNSNSISLHVRRNDYLTVKNSDVFAVCSPDYYKKAMALLSEKIGDFKLFIFSDEIEWVKQNMELPSSAEFVSASQGFADRNYQELMFMSACKHNITANSTFSWWGAWLNNNPKKITITPKKWFVDPKIEAKDTIPSSWIKI